MHASHTEGPCATRSNVHLSEPINLCSGLSKEFVFVRDAGKVIKQYSKVAHDVMQVSCKLLAVHRQGHLKCRSMRRWPPSGLPPEGSILEDTVELMSEGVPEKTKIDRQTRVVGAVDIIIMFK